MRFDLLFLVSFWAVCLGCSPSEKGNDSGGATPQDDNNDNDNNNNNDGDGDGFIDVAAGGDDCDDTNANIHPGASEVCDDAEVDEDCDGLVNDADDSVVGQTTWYVDADNDGYGALDTEQTTCSVPSGAASVGTDCNDADPNVNPGATEVCDDANIDEDCSGAADDDDERATGTVTVYEDLDRDGYGNDAVVAVVCEAEEGWSEVAGDCDDGRAEVNPGAVEVCDDANIDEDCSGAADDDDERATGTVTYYFDDDADGWGDGVSGVRCDILAGESLFGGDCDDADPTLNLDDADSDTYSTCVGDCDDTDSSVLPEDCPYTRASGSWSAPNIPCTFDTSGEALPSWGGCPDCEHSFEGIGVVTSGACIPVFDATFGLDFDDNSFSFGVDYYGNYFRLDGAFEFVIVPTSYGYDYMRWYGYSNLYYYYYGHFNLYR